jgi:hypothetical protein
LGDWAAATEILGRPSNRVPEIVTATTTIKADAVFIGFLREYAGRLYRP